MSVDCIEVARLECFTNTMSRLRYLLSKYRQHSSEAELLLLQKIHSCLLRLSTDDNKLYYRRLIDGSYTPLFYSHDNKIKTIDKFLYVEFTVKVNEKTWTRDEIVKTLNCLFERLTRWKNFPCNSCLKVLDLKDNIVSLYGIVRYIAFKAAKIKHRLKASAFKDDNRSIVGILDRLHSIFGHMYKGHVKLLETNSDIWNCVNNLTAVEGSTLSGNKDLLVEGIPENNLDLLPY